MVKQLRNNRSGGASGMRADHVKQWLAAVQKEDKDGETAGGKEAATTMDEGRPETTAEQEGLENWTRVV